MLGLEAGLATGLAKLLKLHTKPAIKRYGFMLIP
jgi:hypothetical protein